jgi:hypothetical protein
VRTLAAVLLALALAPAASAWVSLTPSTLSNHADPGVLADKGGLFVAYDVESTGTVAVYANGRTHTLATGYAAVSDPQILRLPDGSGSLEVYFGGVTPDLKTGGVLRFTSTNNGVTWTGPVKAIPSSRIGDVQASAQRRDGTPLFSQDGTGFVNVYQGVNGETANNDFARCCGYFESLAVDFSGLAQLAFWSNATSKPGYLYEVLDDTGGQAGQPVNLAAGTDAQAQPFVNRVPLVADGAGNTFMAWPGERYVTIAALGAGKLRRKFAIRTSAAPHQLALVVEPDGGKLWVIWTQNGFLFGTRLRDAAHAAAPVVVKSALPKLSIPYALEAAGAGGAVRAIANLSTSGGDGISTTSLLPGLAVKVVRVKEKLYARVRDDIAPLKGATLRSGKKVVHTTAKGLAPLKGFKRHAHVRVTRAGFVGASFRVP